MWRESGAANAAHVILDLRPSGDVEFMTRAATGGDTSYIGGAAQVAWLKLTRAGSTFTGYVSTNGSTWTAVASTSRRWLRTRAPGSSSPATTHHS